MTAVPATAVSGASRTRQLVADYVDLTKPKVQSLLLFTTVTTMEIAGNPSVSKIGLTCVGGYLSAGGAGAINHYWDRDIDARMRRTASRPIPAGRVSPAAAVRFGIALALASLVLMTLTINLLSALLAFGGFVGYVGVYTMWLKRRTPYNIVIGGAAGAMPPLVAWAATTGSLSWTAVYLFAIVFYWTPPHFWALSLLMKDEYADVGVPMLPVVRGEGETRRQIVLYSAAAVCRQPAALLRRGVRRHLPGRLDRSRPQLRRRHRDPVPARRSPHRAARVPVLNALPGGAVRRHGGRRQAVVPLPRLRRCRSLRSRIRRNG